MFNERVVYSWVFAISHLTAADYREPNAVCFACRARNLYDLSECQCKLERETAR